MGPTRDPVGRHVGWTFGTVSHVTLQRDKPQTPEGHANMIDHFVIFSKTGTVLWSRTLCKLGGDPIDTLINRVLMEDRSGEKKFVDAAYAMQWVFENKLDLVFVVVYQKILQLLYLDELLESVKKVGR